MPTILWVAAHTSTLKTVMCYSVCVSLQASSPIPSSQTLWILTHQIYSIYPSVLRSPLRSCSLCPDGLEAAWSLVLLTLGAGELGEEDRISPNTLEGCCCRNFLIWWRVRRTGGTTEEGEEWRSKFETKRLALKIITNTDLVLLKPPGQEVVI